MQFYSKFLFDVGVGLCFFFVVFSYFYDTGTRAHGHFRSTTVADLEGVRGVHSNPPLEPNYFIFMGKFKKI